VFPHVGVVVLSATERHADVERFAGSEQVGGVEAIEGEYDGDAEGGQAEVVETARRSL
jgi:hypothetical protein